MPHLVSFSLALLLGFVLSCSADGGRHTLARLPHAGWLALAGVAATIPAPRTIGLAPLSIGLGIVLYCDLVWVLQHPGPMQIPCFAVVLIAPPWPAILGSAIVNGYAWLFHWARTANEGKRRRRWTNPTRGATS